MRSTLLLAFAATLACDSPPPRPQVIVQLEADTGTNALASWVRVRILDRDGRIVRDQVEPAGVLPAEIPIVAKDDDATRWVTFEGELFDTLAAPSDDAPIARVRASAGFTADAVRYVRLRFARACLESSECTDGQTCYRGVCLGACFEPSPDEEGNELAPSCGRCELCPAAECQPRPDDDVCGCPGDRCLSGECRSPAPLTSVSGGLRSTCVVRAGRLYCWGSNIYSELGVPDAANSTPTPIEVTLPGPVAQVSTRGNESGTATAHSCALLEDGSLHCWGSNGAGQLGLGRGADAEVAIPTEVESFTSDSIESISVGGIHTCARTAGGELWCWGANSRGQLGIDSTSSADRPVQVPSPSGAPWIAQCTGQLHSCGVSDGRIYCWGFNEVAQVGIPAGPNVLTPTAIDAPDDVRFELVTCGDFHSCGLSEDERAYCWGANGFGNLGREPGELDGAPAPVNGDLVFQFLSCGRSHCCGLESDGSLWCWGRNTQGQLGVGTDVIDRFRPTRTSGPPDRWTALALGEQHSCAVREDEFLWCWGFNESGQLGLGDTTRRFNPTVVCLPEL